MKHFQDDGPTPEELYEPTIKHFKEGNNAEPDYDSSFLHREEDIEKDYEPTIKHFQDD